MMEATPLAGSLVCVGLGMILGSHLGPLARSYIEQADVVFAGLSDGVVELWLQRMHPDVRSLQPYYREGKSRMQTYRQMVEVSSGSRLMNSTAARYRAGSSCTRKSHPRSTQSSSPSASAR